MPFCRVWSSGVLKIVDAVLRWTDRHWVLARVGLVAAAVALGAFLVEVVGVDGTQPGQWGHRPVGAVVVYAMVGVGGGFVLGLMTGCIWFLVGMVALPVRWAVRVPGRTVRWAVRIGGRGVAGYALRALYVLAMAVVLAALGEFRMAGVTFWIDVFFNAGIVTLFGGVTGALSLVIVASWLRDLFARRLASPTEHGPTLNILLPVGFVLGAAVLWRGSDPVDLIFDASAAGIEWVTVPVAFVVIHSFVILAVVLGKAADAVRVRARLLPQLGPEALVWSEGKPVPPRPREVHWSPDAVLAWRGWDIREGNLVGHYGQPWKSSVMVATCQLGHRQPEWRCNCGIYAFKEREATVGVVVGLVALEGIVIEHEHGYRTERARIVELWVRPSETELADRLQQTYPDVAVRTGRPVQGRT